MLQPRQPSPEEQLITARILWMGLTMSMIVYGFALFTTGKISRVEELSQVPSEIQIAALLANVISIIVYYIYKNKVQAEKDFQKKLPLYIVCWALNEMIVLAGFIAVFLTDDGNALIYLTNLMIGLTTNVLCFPKK